MLPSEGDVFRAGVGLVVADADGRVLAMERSDVPGAWQLPQGGLLAGEEPEDAAWRELREETGLSAEHVRLEAASDLWVGYELPERMRSPKTGRGQVHRWFLFRLVAGVELPRLPQGEFRDRRWATLRELIDGAVYFRRPVYEFVAELFGRRLKGP